MSYLLDGVEIVDSNVVVAISGDTRHSCGYGVLFNIII